MTLHTRTLARPFPEIPAAWLPAGAVAYLDIETTGLSAARSQVTLVGLVSSDGPVRRLEQYFVDDPAEEGEVLRAVARRLRAFDAVVTYNGVTFDLPFLRDRARRWEVSWPQCGHLDLLPVARVWRQNYGQLENCRLQTVMAHFRLGRIDATSGLEMIAAYERWLRDRHPADRDLILEHNADDLLLLPDLVPCLSAPPMGREQRLS